jgi:branched-chain amino acid transport system substrate-binding protein
MLDGIVSGRLARSVEILAIVLTAWAPMPAASAPSQLKIGIVTFLSGAASGPFGIPAKTAAEFWIERLNQNGGIGGAQIVPIFVDEAGTTDQVVTNYRRLVTEQKVDLVIGYISSANCTAVPPVAEEFKVLTILFDCGTNRVFEDAKYKYVFRTAAHTGIDGSGAARYVLAIKAGVKTIAGLNQDYAWGHDSWNIFEKAIRKLKPDIRVVDTLWPKLMQGQFASEISKLQGDKPDVIFTSVWGGDFVSFIQQAKPRGLFEQSLVVINNDGANVEELGRDMPDGIALGFRGPHWIEIPDPARNSLQRAFIDGYRAKYKKYPMPHGSYHVVQALQAVKTAYEKAMRAKTSWPTADDVLKALEYLKFDTPSGPITMAIGNGHQAVEEAVYGTTKFNPQLGFAGLANVKVFPVECVNPPDGVKVADWIEKGFLGAKCP